MDHRRPDGPYTGQEMQTVSTPGKVDLVEEDIPSLGTCKNGYTKGRYNMESINRPSSFTNTIVD